MQIVRRSLADSVAEGTLDLIVSRGLRPGSPLPSVGELASLFGVSVIVVREAMATLAGRGLVVRRQGRETLVREPDPEVVSSMIRHQIRLDQVSLEEVQQFRAGLEAQSASLAAGAEVRDTTRLRSVQERLHAATDLASLRDADLEFHTELAKISGNRALYFMIEALHAVISDSLETLYVRIIESGRPASEFAWSTHEPIVAAVESGDISAAVSAMRAHFEHSLPNVDFGIAVSGVSHSSNHE
ncbi:MAG TPA: FCD domain-containing protein [Galbitalea sp.]|nr:FCD domain-containing protein [Galbitalea sp.]